MEIIRGHLLITSNFKKEGGENLKINDETEAPLVDAKYNYCDSKSFVNKIKSFAFMQIFVKTVSFPIMYYFSNS